MKTRHAICIVVDGLRASALGTYGNTNHPTPKLDEFAAGSLAVEWLVSDSPTLEGFYQSAWNGRHALRGTADSRITPLPQLLQQGGVTQWLMTDDQWLAEHAQSQAFDEITLVKLSEDGSDCEVEETRAAKFLAFAGDVWETWREKTVKSQSDSLLWFHTRGMHAAWDAPQSLREQLFDDDEPFGLNLEGPPSDLRDMDDPDVLLGYRVAYAAQVALLDQYLGAFCDLVEQSHGSETVVMLLGSRGFALGEHGQVGSEVENLFSENLHLPWLVRQAGSAIPGERLPGLFQPADVGATLADWFGKAPEWTDADGISIVPNLTDGMVEGRPIAVAGGRQGDMMIRTPAWQMMRCEQESETATGSVELYSKPDDRWEFNDVASRCPEIVEMLSEELQTFLNQCEQNQRLEPPSLPAELIEPPR